MARRQTRQAAPGRAKAKPRGQHGGRRPGAGRKQEKLPEQLLADLGNPPEDPLLKAQWWGRMLEVLQVGVLKGKPWVQMMRDARANAAIASKLLPDEIKAKALRLLEADEQERRNEASATETPREADPVTRNGSRALRRDPA